MLKDSFYNPFTNNITTFHNKKLCTCSFGIPLRISRATEMPPKPESNTPIGAVEVMIPPIFPS